MPHVTAPDQDQVFREEMCRPKLLLILLLMIPHWYSHCCCGNPPAKASTSEGGTYSMEYFSVRGRTRKFGYDKFGYDPRRFIMDCLRKVVNVNDFGAKDDGPDDTQSFTDAWKAACSSSSPVTVLVPENRRYFLKPITFSGPCKSAIIVSIKGTIVASSKRSDWHATSGRQWVLFEGVKDLTVEGGGGFDGDGQIWWKNSCKINKSLPCRIAPTALTFHSCDSLMVDNLNFRDSQQIHVSFEECANVQVSHLTISASENSPNTDGIHVAGTSNMQINNCTIETGDDCISIVSGSEHIRATNIVCGPGHGISIGSLGMNGSEDTVSDVLIGHSPFGGYNKRSSDQDLGGRGYVRNVTFKNIVMQNVGNPIIIDQNYCDSNMPCSERTSAVAINGVRYENIKGTSATEVAVDFNCSRSAPCHGIVMQDVNLVAVGGESTKSTCSNVDLAKAGTVFPSPCTS